jgi:hypothetical protein
MLCMISSPKYQISHQKVELSVVNMLGFFPLLTTESTDRAARHYFCTDQIFIHPNATRDVSYARYRLKASILRSVPDLKVPARRRRVNLPPNFGKKLSF